MASSSGDFVSPGRPRAIRRGSGAIASPPSPPSKRGEAVAVEGDRPQRAVLHRQVQMRPLVHPRRRAVARQRRAALARSPRGGRRQKPTCSSRCRSSRGSLPPPVISRNPLRHCQAIGRFRRPSAIAVKIPAGRGEALRTRPSNNPATSAIAANPKSPSSPPPALRTREAGKGKEKAGATLGRARQIQTSRAGLLRQRLVGDALVQAPSGALVITGFSGRPPAARRPCVRRRRVQRAVRRLRSAWRSRPSCISGALASARPDSSLSSTIIAASSGFASAYFQPFIEARTNLTMVS
jgi:hypothetical protein